VDEQNECIQVLTVQYNVSICSSPAVGGGGPIVTHESVKKTKIMALAERIVACTGEVTIK
jgi:hypothetical protein